MGRSLPSVFRGHWTKRPKALHPLPRPWAVSSQLVSLSGLHRYEASQVSFLLPGPGLPGSADRLRGGWAELPHQGNPCGSLYPPATGGKELGGSPSEAPCPLPHEYSCLGIFNPSSFCPFYMANARKKVYSSRTSLCVLQVGCAHLRSSLELSPRAFSTRGLNGSPKLPAYIPGLSNPSSTGALVPLHTSVARGMQEEWPARLGGRFGLRCLQPLSAWGVAARQCPVGQPVDQRPRSTVPFVLGGPSPQPAHAPGRCRQTVSRRSEPSSRSPLMGEQPHPWLLLHSQDGESRQRCGKPRGRCELSPATTLLPPG